MKAPRFPHATPLYDSHRMVVKFVAVLGTDNIPCAISHEALTDHFGNDSERPVAVFTQHRGAIERIAANLIAKNRRENDGSILIRSSDC